MLWQYLMDQAGQINLPWIIMGDFNSILLNQDRINQGICRSMGDSKIFNCIISANLIEPRFTGNYYTWRGGPNFSIYSKIDSLC